MKGSPLLADLPRGVLADPPAMLNRNGTLPGISSASWSGVARARGQSTSIPKRKQAEAK
jgi:hypothetical protein